MELDICYAAFEFWLMQAGARESHSMVNTSDGGSVLPSAASGKLMFLGTATLKASLRGSCAMFAKSARFITTVPLEAVGLPLLMSRMASSRNFLLNWNAEPAGDCSRAARSAACVEARVLVLLGTRWQPERARQQLVIMCRGPSYMALLGNAPSCILTCLPRAAQAASGDKLYTAW